MNFTFADINKSFLNLVQQAPPKGATVDTEQSGPQKLLFAGKLNKILEKGNLLKETSLAQVKFDLPEGESAKLLEALSEKLSPEKGIGFVFELKKVFSMLSKGDLKNISIDADGLEALKKMLSNAGFEESDINDLIVKLSDGLENKSLSLDEFFDALFDLPFEGKSENDTEPENFLETSTLPFLETILNSLNIPGETIQEILIDADKGEKGISLDTIIEKLQSFQKKSFYTQNHFQTRKGDNNFRLPLEHLSLKLAPEKSSGLTLDEFVESLENLRQKISQPKVVLDISNDNHQKPVAEEQSMDLIKALFKGVEIKNESIDTKAFEFSYEQIRDHFKNELFSPAESKLFVSGDEKFIPGRLFVPGDEKFIPKGSFVPGDEKFIPKGSFVPGDEKFTSQGLFVPENEKFVSNEVFSLNRDIKPEIGKKLNQAFKDMESLLDGKKEGLSNVKDQGIETRGFLKQVKSEAAKLSDHPQLPNSGVKTNETSSGLNMLKAKASFKNLPTHVTHQVGKSLVRAINQGENILRIQLKPPELGRLMMTIDNTGNSIKVTVVTDNPSVREILLSNVNEVRTVLSNSGVNLERFDVDMNSGFKQSMAHAGNQSGNFGKQNRGREKSLFDSNNGEGIIDAVNLLDVLNQGGSMHFVA